MVFRFYISSTLHISKQNSLNLTLSFKNKTPNVVDKVSRIIHNINGKPNFIVTSNLAVCPILCIYMIRKSLSVKFIY